MGKGLPRRNASVFLGSRFEVREGVFRFHSGIVFNRVLLLSLSIPQLGSNHLHHSIQLLVGLREVLLFLEIGLMLLPHLLLPPSLRVLLLALHQLIDDEKTICFLGLGSMLSINHLDVVLVRSPLGLLLSFDNIFSFGSADALDMEESVSATAHHIHSMGNLTRDREMSILIAGSTVFSFVQDMSVPLDIGRKRGELVLSLF